MEGRTDRRKEEWEDGRRNGGTENGRKEGRK
jgi:hypothetical protein